jgi:hypothetical protein
MMDEKVEEMVLEIGDREAAPEGERHRFISKDAEYKISGLCDLILT